MATKEAITYGVQFGIAVARRDPYWPQGKAVDDALAIRRLARSAADDAGALAELTERAATYGAAVVVTDSVTLQFRDDGRTIEVPN